MAGLEAAGADVVGSNCGNGIEDMVEIAREFRAPHRLPLLIQSNAGLPESRDGRLVYNQTPETMAARVPELLDLGVAIVGGCCGTTPEHIRAIRRAVGHDPRAARPARSAGRPGLGLRAPGRVGALSPRPPASRRRCDARALARDVRVKAGSPVRHAMFPCPSRLRHHRPLQ